MKEDAEPKVKGNVYVETHYMKPDNKNPEKYDEIQFEVGAKPMASKTGHYDNHRLKIHGPNDILTIESK